MAPPTIGDITIYLAQEPVDFRLGINGLSVLVEATLAFDPFSRNLFCFTNKRKNQIKRDGVRHVGCLDHARRYFIKAVQAQHAVAGSERGLAPEALRIIRKLYVIEKLARDGKMTAEQRHKLRQEKARSIWNELRAWLDKNLGATPPGTYTGKAISYLAADWPHLMRYLDDGRIEVSNVLCENAIRPFVVGRKNWLFSDKPSGAIASGRLYSIVETAKANGLEPYAYLRLIFERLPQAVTLADIEALLPWNVRAAQDA